MERLTFNVGGARGGPLVVEGRGVRTGKPSRLARATASLGLGRERYDWDYLWMITFTAILFFRPQDQVPAIEPMHLAELTAIAGLAAMAVRRLSAGQAVAKINAEVMGVVLLGAIIVLTIPFSFWPGGSMKVFNDIYVKIILVFALMITTITSPRRIRQMTWVMIIASGYIAARGVLDYVRGYNLVEGNRLRGAVGGMFENPNDLALNLVTFMAPTFFILFEDRKLSRRLFAGALLVVMLAATVFTKSRSGFLGLIAMGCVVLYYTSRTKPGLVFAVVFATVIALPAMPQSFWDRMDSIMNAEEDQTGSRAARIRLLDQGMQVFLDNPITGIGAGQFPNYNGPGIVERWRVTHNVWLQVAAELGIFGVFAFGFLVVRGYTSNFAAMRLLRRKRRRTMADGAMTAPRIRGADRLDAGAEEPDDLGLSPAEREIMDMNAKGMLAAMVGWTVCALFASVAFNWTFYYVLALSVAGREVLQARRAAARDTAPVRVPAAPMVRAHA
jgi:O-antigen ligase